MEDRWLSWVKRLQSIASTGRHFTEDSFDQERYDEIGAIAARMLTALADSPVEMVADLPADFGTGYATPKVEVRAAVFDEGKILLVRELTDGLWAMPGGFADVGRSAGENIEKESLGGGGTGRQSHGSIRRPPQGQTRLPPGYPRFLQTLFLL